MMTYPRLLQTCKASTAIRRRPQPDAMQDDQLLFGDGFRALSSEDNWVHGRAVEDGYEGYVEETALTSSLFSITHRVKAPRTLVFPEPDFKTPPLMMLALNAKLSVKTIKGGFVHAEGAGWIFEKHLTPKEDFAPDYVSMAQSLLGAPYFWGGKDERGYDCSGLVQMALAATGLAAPRDSGPQEATLGRPVLLDRTLTVLQAGDLVFWPGHVGMMVDKKQLLHANAHHMAVVIEPVKTVVERVTPLIGPISSVKRL